MNPELNPFSLKEKKLFRHDLIQKDFREIIENKEYLIPENTDAIMVLSGPPPEAGGDDHNEERTVRIQLGIDVYKKIVAKKLKKEVVKLTDEDLRGEQLPLLILNGEFEQIPMMKKIAIDELNFPTEKIRELPCGHIGTANTKTQFEVFKEDPELSRLSHIILITSSYHVPRVARTASANLPENIDFDVIGVPLKDFKFDVFKKTREEVKRIVQYSEKGDISKYPRSNKAK